MKKRAGAAAGMPTALVASTSRLRSRRRRGRRRRRDLGSIAAVTEPLRAVPKAVERALPRRRRSAIGRLRRRRRRSDLMRIARHAGTAVSAVGFAADLLNQIAAISEAADRSQPEPARRRQPQANGQPARRRSAERKPNASTARNGSRPRTGARSGAANSDHPTDHEE